MTTFPQEAPAPFRAATTREVQAGASGQGRGSGSLGRGAVTRPWGPKRARRAAHGPRAVRRTGRRRLHSYFSSRGSTGEHGWDRPNWGFSGRPRRSRRTRAARVRSARRDARQLTQPPAAAPQRRHFHSATSKSAEQGGAGSNSRRPSGQQRPSRCAPTAAAPQGYEQPRCCPSREKLPPPTQFSLPCETTEPGIPFSFQSRRIRGAVKETQIPSYLSFSSLDRKCAWRRGQDRKFH